MRDFVQISEFLSEDWQKQNCEHIRLHTRRLLWFIFCFFCDYAPLPRLTLSREKKIQKLQRRLSWERERGREKKKSTFYLRKQSRMNAGGGSFITAGSLLLTGVWCRVTNLWTTTAAATVEIIGCYIIQIINDDRRRRFFKVYIYCSSLADEMILLIWISFRFSSPCVRNTSVSQGRSILTN